MHVVTRSSCPPTPPLFKLDADVTEATPKRQCRACVCVCVCTCFDAHVYVSTCMQWGTGLSPFVWCLCGVTARPRHSTLTAPGKTQDRALKKGAATPSA